MRSPISRAPSSGRSSAWSPTRKLPRRSSATCASSPRSNPRRSSASPRTRCRHTRASPRTRSVGWRRSPGCSGYISARRAWSFSRCAPWQGACCRAMRSMSARCSSRSRLPRIATSSPRSSSRPVTQKCRWSRTPARSPSAEACSTSGRRWTVSPCVSSSSATRWKACGRSTRRRRGRSASCAKCRCVQRERSCWTTPAGRPPSRRCARRPMPSRRRRGSCAS